MSDDKRKIPELVSRYVLEPELRDVYVEGYSDVHFYKRVCRHAGILDVAFYPIQTVEIPTGALHPEGLQDGDRDRVIFLSGELAKHLDPQSHAVTCLADREYDVVTGYKPASPFLVLIDWASLECYAFNEQSISDVISRIAPHSSLDGAIVIKDVTTLLKDVFSLRASNIVLGMGLTWIETFEKSCDLSESPIEFDVSDFVSRYLGKGAALNRKEEFLAKFREIRSTLPEESRLCIRGHDISGILSWYLRNKLRNNHPLLRKEILEELLLLSVDLNDVVACPNIRRLLERLQSI